MEYQQWVTRDNDSSSSSSSSESAADAGMHEAERAKEPDSSAEHEGAICSLPDEVVEHIFKFLPAAELLRCRRVCRRWRDLGLRPEVWRTRVISDVKYTGTPGDEEHNRNSAEAVRGAAVLATTARLAPMVDTLRMEGGPWRLSGVLLATAARCAARSLCIRFDDHPGPIAVIISRQVALGRLRHLELNGEASIMHWSTYFAVHDLMQLLISVDGLEELDYRHRDLNSGMADSDYQHSGAPPVFQVDEGSGTASLRVLRIKTPAPWSQRYMERLLRRHASTLEEIRFYGMCSDQCLIPAELTAVLGSMPRLRALTTPILADLDETLGWPSLQELHIRVELNNTEYRARLVQLKAFLRSAVRRFPRLGLLFAIDDWREDASADVVKALGACRQSRAALQHLRVAFEDGNSTMWPSSRPQEVVGTRTDRLSKASVGLGEVLHRLPSLVSLHLWSSPAPAFLDAVCPESLPNLRELFILAPTGSNHCGPCCGHGLLQRQSRMSLRRRNPRLVTSIFCQFCNCCHECTPLEGSWTTWTCVLVGDERDAPPDALVVEDPEAAACDPLDVVADFVALCEREWDYWEYFSDFAHAHFLDDPLEYWDYVAEFVDLYEKMTFHSGCFAEMAAMYEAFDEDGWDAYNDVW